MPCLSMNEKIVVAFDLSIDLGESLNNGTLLVDEQTEDMIWGHADGLTAKHLYALRDGKCSLAAFIEFDPAEAEAELDRDIKLMRRMADDCT